VISLPISVQTFNKNLLHGRWRKHVYPFGGNLVLAVLVGLLSGTATAIFLHGLHWITDLQEHDSKILFFLPVCGVLTALIYRYTRPQMHGGTALLFESYRNPNRPLSLWLAPLVLLGTWLSHLGNASVGREGTGIQMGASLATMLNTRLFPSLDTRKLLIALGMAAGLSSVYGTPLAGVIFTYEILRKYSIPWHSLLHLAISSFVADYICRSWGITHVENFSYAFTTTTITSSTLFWMVIAGIIWGLCSRLYLSAHHFFTRHMTRIWPDITRRMIFSSLIFVGIVFVTDAYELAGLGIPTITRAFTEVVPIPFFLGKLLLTTFILSAGFKGGEVTPLFFIGATLGSALSLIIPLPIGLLSGCGLICLFAGTSKAPFGCLLMGAELFGWTGLGFLSIACAITSLTSGSRSLYTPAPNNPDQP
jgi:H+/Cl- antiporter ClcA